MEIKAKSIFDFETVKAFSHVALYGRQKPKKFFVGMNIVCAVILLMNVVTILLAGVDTSMIIMLASMPVLFAMNCYLYFLFPKVQFNSMKNVHNMENDYTFCDEIIQVSSKCELYQDSEELKYAMIVKVMETSKYLFIYRHQNQAYIVDKATILGGTADELKEKLRQNIKGKYIACKY